MLQRRTRRRQQKPEACCTASKLLRYCMFSLVLVVPAWILYAYSGPISTATTGVAHRDAAIQGNLRTFVPTRTDTAPVPWTSSPTEPSAAGDTPLPVPAAPTPAAASSASDISAVPPADVGQRAEQPLAVPDAASAPAPQVFPVGSQMEVPAAGDAASRHVVADKSWAAEPLEQLHSQYVRILEDYPQHIREMVLAMPPHRFKEIRRARVHYDGVKPVVVDENPARSGFQLSNRYGSNSAVASNVCFDTRKNKLILYRGDGGRIIPDKDKHLMTKVGHAGFKWTWSVTEEKGSPPKNAKWYKGMSVLASPAFDKHVTHFSEAVTFVFHANLHPRVYPWWAEAKRVVHVKVKSTDFDWSKDFMRVCMSGIPGHEQVDLIWRDQLKHGLHCFERAGLMAQQTHEYGYHADPWEAQVFRESAFKMFDVPEPPVLKPNQKIRTVVLDRKGRKKMTNPDKVVDVIQQTELAKFDFLPETKKQPVFFEKGTSFKTQITVMRHTDVLVGLHGSGLNNAMFMEPGSVVIAIMPSNYVEYEWHNFITGSGSTYLFQPNTDNAKHSANCKPYPKKCDTLRPFEAKTSTCLPMWYCDAKVDIGVTELLFRQTNFLIRNMKREMAKQHHAMKFNGGRNPSGKVTKLDE